MRIRPKSAVFSVFSLVSYEATALLRPEEEIGNPKFHYFSAQQSNLCCVRCPLPANMVLTEEQKRSYDRCLELGVQDDLVLLSNVNEVSVERVLSARFANEDMYTAVGPVLIAMNPYRYVGLFLILEIYEF